MDKRYQTYKEFGFIVRTIAVPFTFLQNDDRATLLI